jgi:hypothetical protein
MMVSPVLREANKPLTRLAVASGGNGGLWGRGSLGLTLPGVGATRLSVASSSDGRLGSRGGLGLTLPGVGATRLSVACSSDGRLGGRSSLCLALPGGRRRLRTSQCGLLVKV